LTEIFQIDLSGVGVYYLGALFVRNSIIVTGTRLAISCDRPQAEIGQAVSSDTDSERTEMNSASSLMISSDDCRAKDQ
jgi:hypothetical protein